MLVIVASGLIRSCEMAASMMRSAFLAASERRCSGLGVVRGIVSNFGSQTRLFDLRYQKHKHQCMSSVATEIVSQVL